MTSKINYSQLNKEKKSKSEACPSVLEINIVPM